MLRKQYSINTRCEVQGVPRSSTHDHAQPSEDRLVRIALIELAGQWPPDGYGRLTAQQERRGLLVVHEVVLRLMNELVIAGEASKPKSRITASEHCHPRIPNRLDGLEPAWHDPMWVVDLASIRSREKSDYSQMISSKVKRCVRGRHQSWSSEHELTIWPGGKGVGGGGRRFIIPIRRVQYAATVYVDLPKYREVEIRSASVGGHNENDYAETLRRIMKE